MTANFIYVIIGLCVVICLVTFAVTRRDVE